jgi:hypothetical protein
VSSQGASRSFAFASGMAALSAVLRLVRAGEHVVAGDDIYGGTSRLLTRVAPDLGISVSNVLTTDTEWGPLLRMCLQLLLRAAHCCHAAFLPLVGCSWHVECSSH